MSKWEQHAREEKHNGPRPFVTSYEAHLKRLWLQVVLPPVRVHLRSEEGTDVRICVLPACVRYCVDGPFARETSSAVHACEHSHTFKKKKKKKRQLHVRSLLFKLPEAVKSWKSFVVSMVRAQTLFIIIIIIIISHSPSERLRWRYSDIIFERRI